MIGKKVSKVDVPEDDPFKNDILGRDGLAEHLTALLSTVQDPFVFSLTSPWGTGKTTFVKMWKQHLENEGYLTLYYNAWENDFVEDPLIPFVEEISTRIESKLGKGDDQQTKRVRKFRELANRVAWRTLPLALKFATGGLLQTDDFMDEADEDAVLDLAEQVGQEAIAEYNAMKDEIGEFRDTLSTLVQEVKREDDANPVIIFVDELDRCKPDHAVQLIERIKHLFSVPGITFVLAMEPNQLQHSIKALYGQGMDARGYLRRFIDLEMPLPTPQDRDYVSMLFAHHDLPDILEVDGNTEKPYINLLAAIFDEGEYGLRRQQQFVLHYSLVMRMLKGARHMIFEVGVFLTLLMAFQREYPSSFKAYLKRGSEAQSTFREMVIHILDDSVGGRPTQLIPIFEAADQMWFCENGRDYVLKVREVLEEGGKTGRRMQNLDRFVGNPNSLREIGKLIHITEGATA